MKKSFKIAAAVAVMLSTSACSTLRTAFDNRRGYYTDNLPDLRRIDVQNFVADQNEVMNQFVRLAGVAYERLPLDPGPPLPHGTTRDDPRIPAEYYLAPTDNNWRPVINAGMHYVDVRCDRFIDALFWLNRIRETTSREIRFAGAASAAALSILSASQQLISLAPLGFGFLDQSVNNLGEGLLYALHPTVVRTLVEEQQTAYRNGLAGHTYESRSVALETVQGYAAICLPAAIEAEVNRAITERDFHPVEYQREAAPVAKPPAAAPPVAPAPTEAEGPPQIEPTDD
jgi:hypothetical protein